MSTMTFWLWQTGVRSCPSISSVESRWISQVYVIKILNPKLAYGMPKYNQYGDLAMYIHIYRVLLVQAVLIKQTFLLCHFKLFKRAFRWLNIGRLITLHGKYQKTNSSLKHYQFTVCVITCYSNKKQEYSSLSICPKYMVLGTLCWV